MLESIQGYKIEFTQIPFQMKEGINYQTSTRNEKDLRVAINKLLDINAIEKCSPLEGQFISPVFLVPKPDGSYRFILNLKRLNLFVKEDHFKMEDLRTALNIMQEGEFMCRLDLNDAYLMVPIHFLHRKYLRFIFDGQLYQFLALPFGLSSAPRVFTKLIKPILAWLRERGIKIVATWMIF